MIEPFTINNQLLINFPRMFLTDFLVFLLVIFL